MKRVINIVDLVPRIEDVPADWILCSVSGEYRPKEEYMQDGEVVRTNCLKTYNMPSAEMDILKAKKDEVALGMEYRVLWRELNEYKQRQALKNAGIPIAELIARLQVFADSNPDAIILQRYSDDEGWWLDSVNLDFAPHGNPEDNLFSIG